jgi:hypothetical protein
VRDDLVALLLALATENDELRQQLATAENLLWETAIEAGQLHARIAAIQDEHDAWKQEVERLDSAARSIRLNAHERRVRVRSRHDRCRLRPRPARAIKALPRALVLASGERSTYVRFRACVVDG